MTWLRRHQLHQYILTSIWPLPVLSIFAGLIAVAFCNWLDRTLGLRSIVSPDTARIVIGTDRSAGRHRRTGESSAPPTAASCRSSWRSTWRRGVRSAPASTTASSSRRTRRSCRRTCRAPSARSTPSRRRPRAAATRARAGDRGLPRVPEWCGRRP